MFFRLAQQKIAPDDRLQPAGYRLFLLPDTWMHDGLRRLVGYGRRVDFSDAFHYNIKDIIKVTMLLLYQAFELMPGMPAVVADDPGAERRNGRCAAIVAPGPDGPQTETAYRSGPVRVGGRRHGKKRARRPGMDIWMRPLADMGRSYGLCREAGEGQWTERIQRRL